MAVKRTENFTDMVMENVVGVVGDALDQFRTLTAENRRKTLLKKLSQNYEALDIATIMRAKVAMGHKDGEEKPCEVCRLIARKEIELMDEGDLNGP